MFILAFLYTKISYNNFQIDGKQKIISSSRAPATFSTTSRNQIPLHNGPASFLRKKINSQDLILFSNVSPYEGTIVGNVSVESFGPVIDDKKKVNLMINDIRTVTKGALFEDVLSHLISSKILDKRVSWFEYFEAYKKGINGESYTFSFYTIKSLEEAFLDSENIFSENVTGNYPFEFTKLKHSHHYVDAVMKSMIQNGLIKLFPQIQFFDLMESNSDPGNFQILARLRPQDKIQWLEVQEKIHAQYNLNSNIDEEIDSRKHFELLRMDVYSESMDKSLRLFKMGKKNYTLKLIEQFNSKIKWNEIPNEDYHDIVMDEAYVLGKIHGRSLGPKSSEYIHSWATIPGASIDEQVIGLKYGLMDMEIKK